ncbi:MAG: hypothetical protein ACXADY_07355 [Candidatus Hodarchaeales archaeon]
MIILVSITIYDNEDLKLPRALRNLKILPKPPKEEEESLVEKKTIQQPQLCSNCYTIIMANKTRFDKCGRIKFLDKE